MDYYRLFWNFIDTDYKMKYNRLLYMELHCGKSAANSFRLYSHTAYLCR